MRAARKLFALKSTRNKLDFVPPFRHIGTLKSAVYTRLLKINNAQFRPVTLSWKGI